MALKSGVFACLILALCVSCNNVMAEENSGKETEKGGIIIGRGLPIETEKSGWHFFPRSENLEETEKRGFIIPRGLPIETEKSGAPFLGRRTSRRLRRAASSSPAASQLRLRRVERPSSLGRRTSRRLRRVECPSSLGPRTLARRLRRVEDSGSHEMA